MPTSPSPSQAAASSPLHIPDLLLGAATLPLLLGLVASKAMSQAIQDLGLLSEEVFRGDRLPFLPTPAHPEATPEASVTD